MNDQNQNDNTINEMLSGLDDAQKEEFQKLARETLSARVLDRIVSTLSESEIEEMNALPEDDPTAVEVFMQSKFSKEELEQMAREELDAIRMRMIARVEESVSTDAMIEEAGQTADDNGTSA